MAKALLAPSHIFFGLVQLSQLTTIISGSGNFGGKGTEFVLERDEDDRDEIRVVDGSSRYYFGGDPGPDISGDEIDLWDRDLEGIAYFNIANSIDSRQSISFSCNIQYRARTYVNDDSKGTLRIKFEDMDGCPFTDKENWHGQEEVYVQNLYATTTIPWIGFNNVTEGETHDSKGFPYIESYYFIPSAVDEKAEFWFESSLHHNTGTYYYEETDFEFCVEDDSDAAIVKSDFMGLAMEWDDVIEYLSVDDGKEINPYLLNFFETVNKGHINVNSNSGMYVFLEESGLDDDFYRSTGVSLNDLDFLEKFATETGQHLVLGLPMLIEDDSEYATTFLNDGILQRISTENIIALEYGNEPDHWTKSKKGFRDPETFSYESYLKEFKALDKKIISEWPDDVGPVLDVQGPSLAGCNTNPGKDCWNKYLSNFAENTRAKYIAVHRYGRSGCSQFSTAETLLADPDPNNGDYKFLEDLHKEFKSKGENKETVWGEGNALSCGGIDGVSNTFSASLWTVDNLLENAVRHVSRSHIHADMIHNYSPFTQKSNGKLIPHATVYGMLQFSRLLDGADQSKVYRVNLCDGSQNRHMKAYAIENDETGKTRVIVISKEWRTSEEFEVKVNVPNGAGGSARVTTMTSPNFYSTNGIKVAGQYYGDNGKLRGSYRSKTIYRDGNEPFVIYSSPAMATVIEYDTN